jgi:hypothetical protein
MIRVSLGLIVASLVSHAASADDVFPPAQAVGIQPDTHCAALGEGFFPVNGSNACIRISGHISAGAGFATGSESAGSFHPRIGGAPANGFGAETAATGDLRFDTPAGPARVYIDVRKDTNRRWAVDGQ